MLGVHLIKPGLQGYDPVTHENDDCYIVPTNQGSVRFDRGDMLITQYTGEIYPCKPDIFAATYEPVDEELPAKEA